MLDRKLRQHLEPHIGQRVAVRRMEQVPDVAEALSYEPRLLFLQLPVLLRHLKCYDHATPHTALRSHLRPRHHFEDSLFYQSSCLFDYLLFKFILQHSILSRDPSKRDNDLAAFESRLRKELVDPDFSRVDLALVDRQDNSITIFDDEVLLLRVNHLDTLAEN